LLYDAVVALGAGCGWRRTCASYVVAERCSGAWLCAQRAQLTKLLHVYCGEALARPADAHSVDYEAAPMYSCCAGVYCVYWLGVSPVCMCHCYVQLAGQVIVRIKFWLVCIGWCSCTRRAFAESMLRSGGFFTSAAGALLMRGFAVSTGQSIGVRFQSAQFGVCGQCHCIDCSAQARDLQQHSLLSRLLCRGGTLGADSRVVLVLALPEPFEAVTAVVGGPTCASGFCCVTSAAVCLLCSVASVQCKCMNHSSFSQSLDCDCETLAARISS
jgi:hypothetical protein